MYVHSFACIKNIYGFYATRNTSNPFCIPHKSQDVKLQQNNLFQKQVIKFWLHSMSYETPQSEF